MQITCWTVAANGTLPITFPVNSLSGVRLLIAGGSVGKRDALRSNPSNFAACVNEAARVAGHGVLLTLPPDLLALDTDWQALLEHALQLSERGCFFYGDYLVRESGGDRCVQLRPDIGDITEREDWGPLWAVRAEWLNSVGGLDEDNPRAAFYDLLLKSWGKGRRVHVGGVLGTVAAPESETADAQLKDKLFFPGRGKLGGFSYLFLDKEEERQIEQVFYNFLKRENAWLDRERTAIPRSPTTSEPLVSVVTPVYNRARFIGLAIESVQQQTLTDWEYVIVDNGSTDGTQDVVKSYASKDARVRLVQNDRNVIALALNIGVRHAQGKYVAQLDSDDEYLPHTLQKMTEALDANPTWGLAISYYELMNEAGNSLAEFGIIRHEQYNRNNILRRDGAGALRCWHKSVIEEFAGFDEEELGHYGEDYDLVLKCGEKYEVGRVHEVCYRYRRHAGNTDVLRAHEMKIKNKTIARLNALKRRKSLSA
jgi:hypothetical protein